MFAIAYTFGQHPALNVVSGWICWEVFCRAIVNNQCVSVVAVNDYTMRASYDALIKKIKIGR